MIHGYIQTYDTGLDARAVHVHNRSALASLPSSGSLLRPEMFHQLPLLHSPITRSTQLIAYASENRWQLYMHQAWIGEFEDLLRRLCWTSATAIETYCGNRFEWRAENRGEQDPADLFVRGWKRVVYDSYHCAEEVPFGPDGFPNETPHV
ncbi:MAG: hypothetical protein JF591_15260 [Lysobacter sp.]|nr:hypothetical protein [Lysobacter sp.]